MPLVQFGEFAPDQPDYNNLGSGNIRNVLPATKDAYGPMSALGSYSSALGAACIGSAFMRAKDATINGFAGTAAKLYRLSGGSTTWADVSIAANYTVAGGETWQFAVMDQRVTAWNINTVPQTFLVGTDALFSNLSATAPQARYAVVVKDFLFVGNTTDGTNGARPQRVWWSALGDGTNWPTPGTVTATQVQSDFQDLLGDGGWVQGLAAGLSGADVAIIQERRVWRGTYVGSPDIFSFAMVDAARGTPIPGSVVSGGGMCFYISDIGFMAFDGQTAVPIGDQKVDNFFWTDIDQNNLANVSASMDPQRKMVFWAYPGAQNSGGVPNKIMVYHYTLNRFTIIDLITVERLATGMTVGYTLDQLNPFGTLETLPYSLDSRVWTGGRLQFGAFGSNHKFGFFDGANLAATLDTTEAELNDNGITYINRAWAEVDASNVQIQVGYRNRTADPVTFTAPVAVNSTNSSAGVRATGRFHRGRVMIPAGANWNFAQGVDFDGRKAGKR